MRESTKDKKFVVYMHRNLINGKVYIGQTCDLSERWRCNGKNYFNSIKFFNAIKKYGWDNFSHEVLYDNLNQEAADRLEKELIKKYNSIKNGYNLKEGGARGVLSEESLKKMGDSVRRGFIEHPERREKIRQKAKEVCERYRGFLPSTVNPVDVYVAINAQYHDYANLFKSWFGDRIDHKIIESAIVFWFKDEDNLGTAKLVTYFREK